MKRLVAFLVFVVVPAPCLAWNEHGHMVVARLAWNQLSADQRAKVIAILKNHPHYAEYLAARKPDGFTEDEWVFMRAATWADWVRGRREFDHPTWHYINYPIVPPGSAVKASEHEPPAAQENVVNQLAVAVDKIRTGTDREKAVYMTWLFHLVGDIHQPLHCTAAFSEQFPNGDKGGNDAFIRIRSSPVKLHAMWDGLLGTGTSAGSIGSDVREIEGLTKNNADMQKEIDAHRTFESWGREGQELARRVVYLNGDLKVAASSGRRIAADADAPTAADGYAQNCGRVARIQVGKAGLRLATQIKSPLP
jgi:S1/P1 Nuclease